MKNQTILIIEDELPIRDMLRFALQTTEFELLEAENAQAAYRIIGEKLPDLILLDWMLPGESGISIAKRLKTDTTTQDIPLIMLTARADEENKVRALEIGADDYVVKPFSPRELLARIKAVLRRGPAATPEGIYQIKDLQVDSQAHRATLNNKILELSSLEFKLLKFFITHPNRTYSREQLLNHVWGMSSDVDDRTVDVTIRRLRKSLADENYAKLIQTVRGMGYRFSEEL